MCSHSTHSGMNFDECTVTDLHSSQANGHARDLIQWPPGLREHLACSSAVGVLPGLNPVISR